MAQVIRNNSKRNAPQSEKDLDASNAQLLKVGSGSALDITSSAVKANNKAFDQASQPSEVSLADGKSKALTPNGIHQTTKGKYNSELFSGETSAQDQPVLTQGIETAVSSIKQTFSDLSRRILETENELSRHEIKFYSLVSSKSVELEGLTEENEQEIEQHKHMYEMLQLAKLEQKLRILEHEKIKLIRKEFKSTAHLNFRSDIHGFYLDEIEQIQENEARKRELIVTQLYAKLNNEIRRKVTNAEGSLQVIQRKRTKAGTKQDNVLFDGIRDKKLKANWIRTPQPLVIKLMNARCMRDKVPKGEYVIRATVMDRLVENKLFYKFVEYGQRVKEQNRTDKERSERLEKGIQLTGMKLDLGDSKAFMKETRGEFGETKKMFIPEGKPAQEEDHNSQQEKRPLFADSDDEQEADEENANLEGRKGVRWNVDVTNETKVKRQKTAAARSVISNTLNQTKIGYDSQKIDDIYDGKKTEKVWIDFGKVTTNVIKYDPFIRENMHLNGHRMYFMLPPALDLQPSNVILFELVFLSGKDTSQDQVVGWGALPIVNGEFQLSTGKFKVPLLYGNVDFSSNKFKDLESKYMRNVDEWLCNLYIDVRKIELFDFRQHEEKIEFTVPKKLQRLLEQQRRNSERISIEGSLAKLDSDESDYSSDESEGDNSADEWDLNTATPGFEDPTKISYHDYKYCIYDAENVAEITNETEATNGFRRVLFILMEIVSDLGFQKGSTVKWIGTAVLAFCVLWFRMFIHYLGQYVLLKIINCPVTNLSFTWYKMRLDYAYWNVYQEVLVIAVGVIANSLLFMFLVGINHVANRWIFCFPVKFCKIIAWYGLCTCLDFFFIVIVDICNQEIDGDLFKVYNYYQATNNSGFIGLFVTFLIQFFLLILNIYLFYNYIVFVHCDAKISDIYLRISGYGKGYYMPDDNEVSWAYLKQTYCLGEINNNRIVVNELKIPRTFTQGPPLIAKSYQFQRFLNEQSVQTDQVYFANEIGQILAVDFLNIKLFRDSTLHGIIEETKNWNYRVPGLRAPVQMQSMSRNSSGELQNSRDSGEQSRGNRSGQDRSSQRLSRPSLQGATRLVKNIIRHRQNIEIAIQAEDDDDRIEQEANGEDSGGRNGKRGITPGQRETNSRGKQKSNKKQRGHSSSQSKSSSSSGYNGRTGGAVIIQK